MRVYISGPMTGLPEYNYPAFKLATSLLRSVGYEVVCPTEVFGGDTTRPYAEYMRAHIANLLTVQGIVLLDGWEMSRGACFEFHMAKVLDLPVFDLHSALEHVA